MSQDLNYEKYSEKSIVVRGDAISKYKEDLKNIGGVFNERLKGGPGWIFFKNLSGEIDKLMCDISEGKKPSSSSSSSSSVENNKDLINRLYKLENLVKSQNIRIQQLEEKIGKIKRVKKNIQSSDVTVVTSTSEPMKRARLLR